MTLSVNIPVDELFMRMQELPDKSKSFSVIYDLQDEAVVKEFFNHRQLPVIEWIDWASLKSMLISEQQTERMVGGVSKHYYWEPAHFIRHFSENYLNNTQAPQSILDLACGSGRDSVYLAMQGHNVYSVDRSAGALERCKLTASRLNTSIATRSIDLERDFSNKQLREWPTQYDAVIVCRYLHRPLMPQIINMIKTGGYIAYHTFLVGSEKIGSPKNPDFLLKENELAQTFSEFSIALDEIEYLADGRPLSNFIAQKTNPL